MSPLQALIALFRENAIPMSDRNGVLHDIISAALAESDQSEEVQSLREANERFGKRQEWWTERMYQLEQDLDKARAALAEAAEAESEPAKFAEIDEWKQVVIDGLVTAHIYTSAHEIDQSKALNDLISWHVAIALDPCVSSEAQALIDRGRAEAQADAEPIGYTTRAQIEAMNNGYSRSFTVRDVNWTHIFREDDVAVYLYPPRRESAELSDEEIYSIYAKALAEAPHGKTPMELRVLCARAVLRAAGEGKG